MNFLSRRSRRASFKSSRSKRVDDGYEPEESGEREILGDTFSQAEEEPLAAALPLSPQMLVGRIGTGEGEVLGERSGAVGRRLESGSLQGRDVSLPHQSCEPKLSQVPQSTCSWKSK